MKKRILSLLLCLVLCFSFTFVVSAAEVYPKYSNVELQMFNDQYAASGSPLSLSITGDLEQFNGYYLLIFGIGPYYYITFSQSISVDSSGEVILVDTFYSPEYNSSHLNLTYDSFKRYTESTISTTYSIFYSSINLDTDSYTIFSTFPWPSISSGQQFGNDFPSFISSAWSGLTNFIVDNKLVLIIFGLSFLFAIVGLVKRCMK